MSADATLVLIKPDALAKNLTGAVLERLGRTGLSMVGAKVSRVSRALACEHYAALESKPFFNDLLAHLCGELHRVDSVLAFVYAGPGAVETVREAAGATNPDKAEWRSLRGAYGRNTAAGIMENVLHASSDAKDAQREIKLWFHPEELLIPLYPTKPDPSTPRLTWA